MLEQKRKMFFFSYIFVLFLLTMNEKWGKRKTGRRDVQKSDIICRAAYLPIEIDIQIRSIFLLNGRENVLKFVLISLKWDLSTRKGFSVCQNSTLVHNIYFPYACLISFDIGVCSYPNKKKH